MKKVPRFSDERLGFNCVHCGAVATTKDHAPSKIFLDQPYPLLSPFSPSCKNCNNKFSKHEEYLACFLDCVQSNTVENYELLRDKTVKALRRNERLKGRIDYFIRKGVRRSGAEIVLPILNEEAVRTVILKLARCHANFEFDELYLQEPKSMSAFFLNDLETPELVNFETTPEYNLMPELLSRCYHRDDTIQSNFTSGDWLYIQEGRYRYLAVGCGPTTIRGVINENFGYEVIWNS